MFGRVFEKCFGFWGFERVFEKMKNWEVFWWGPHLKKYYLWGSQEKIHLINWVVFLKSKKINKRKKKGFKKIKETIKKKSKFVWVYPAGLHGWLLPPLVSKGWSQIDLVAAKWIRSHCGGCHAGSSCKTNRLDIFNIGSFFFFFF